MDRAPSRDDGTVCGGRRRPRPRLTPRPNSPFPGKPTRQGRPRIATKHPHVDPTYYRGVLGEGLRRRRWGFARDQSNNGRPRPRTPHASSGSACTVQQIPRSECEIDIQCVPGQLLRTLKHFMHYAFTLGQSFARSGRRASPGRIGRWRYGRRTKYPVRTLSQSVCTSPPPSFCSRTWPEGVPRPGARPRTTAVGSQQRLLLNPFDHSFLPSDPPPPSSSLEGSSPVVECFWWPRPFGNATPSASAALQRAGRRQPDGPRDQTSLDTNGPPCPPPSPWSRFLQPL